MAGALSGATTALQSCRGPHGQVWCNEHGDEYGAVGRAARASSPEGSCRRIVPGSLDAGYGCGRPSSAARRLRRQMQRAPAPVPCQRAPRLSGLPAAVPECASGGRGRVHARGRRHQLPCCGQGAAVPARLPRCPPHRGPKLPCCLDRLHLALQAGARAGPGQVARAGSARGCDQAR